MENNNPQNTVSESAPFIKRNILPDLLRLNHSYWFRLILTEEEETTEIRYKVAVRFIKPLTDTTVLLSIERIPDEVYINDHSPDKPVDMLAYETGKVFYPMAVEVSTQMKWLGIRNYEQIVQRWEKSEPNLRRYFAGEEANRYLNRMGEKIAAKANLEKIFEKDLFIQVYFRTLYADYISDIGIPIAFPVGDYGDVQYKVKTLINQEVKDGRREVTQTGIEIQKQEVPESDSESKNTYTAKYVLDTKTNCIREMEAEWKWESPVRKKIRVILFPLRQPTAKDSFIIEEDKKQDEKQSKGFFSRLFGG